MSSFEWETDDKGWESDPPTPPKPKRTLPKPLIWGMVLVLLIAGFGVYFLANRQVKNATNRISEDVLRSHQLVQQAVENGDGALFQNQLARKGARLTWSRGEQALFANNVLWERADYGFSLQSSKGMADAEVNLSADLQIATVYFDLPYASRMPDGQMGTVTLRQTAVYQLNDTDGRWQLADPDRTLGSSRNTYRSDLLTMSYPAYDQEISLRLGRDLNDALRLVCNKYPSIDCDKEHLFQLSLETDALFKPPQNAQDGKMTLILPSMTALGTPIDETGYTTLYHNYLVPVIFKFMRGARQSATDYYPFQPDRALLVDLGVRQWPLLAEETAVTQPTTMPKPDLAIICQDNPNNLLRYSPETDQWTTLLTEMGLWTDPALNGKQDLFLTRYPLRAGKRRQEIVRWQDGQIQVLMEADWLPDRGLYVQNRGGNGRYLTIFEYINPTGSSYTPPTYQLIDLNTCQPGDCAPQELPGQPIWSPDGQHILSQNFSQTEEQTLQLQDETGQNIGAAHPGWQPQWLDNNTYIHGSSSAWLYSITHIQDGRTNPFLKTDYFAAFISKEIISNHRFYLSSVLWSNDTSLIIQGHERGSNGDAPGKTYIFHLERNPDWQAGSDEPPGEITLLSEQAVPQWQASNNLTNHWWMMREQFPTDDGQFKLTLFDQQTGNVPVQTYTYPNLLLKETSSPPTYAQSADGNWLVISYDGVLTLISPDQGFEQTIVPPTPNCSFAGWLDGSR